MTSLPPAGWYPDPEAGGTRWRWWDGDRWAAPASAANPYFARALALHRSDTTRYGNWLRWGMVGSALVGVFVYLGFAIMLHGNGVHFLSTDANGAPQISGGMVAFELVQLPLSFMGLAYIGLLIAWIYHAGKFAEALGWPAMRSRTLGAFSVLIPIVNFWWPYEALRDSYPPGSNHDLLLRWWVSYIVSAFVGGIIAFASAFVGGAAVTSIGLVIAACLLAVPVFLGWKVIDEIEAMQRAAS